MECPACGYVRKIGDTASKKICPSCQVHYSSVKCAFYRFSSEPEVDVLSQFTSKAYILTYDNKFYYFDKSESDVLTEFIVTKEQIVQIKTLFNLNNQIDINKKYLLVNDCLSFKQLYELYDLTRVIKVPLVKFQDQICSSTSNKFDINRKSISMTLIRCKDCGHQISANAIACPNCGGKLPKTKKDWRGFFIFIFLIIFFSNVFDKFNKNKIKAIQNAPELQVSAETLMSDYESNEVAADGKYKNKNIRVSGVIDNIGKDILDTPYVTLKTNKNLFSVQCMFDNSSEAVLATLRKDQELTMVGQVSGKLGNIILKDCSF